MLDKIVAALEEIRAEEFDYEVLRAASDVMGEDMLTTWRHRCRTCARRTDGEYHVTVYAKGACESCPIKSSHVASIEPRCARWSLLTTSSCTITSTGSTTSSRSSTGTDFDAHGALHQGDGCCRQGGLRPSFRNAHLWTVGGAAGIRNGRRDRSCRVCGCADYPQTVADQNCAVSAARIGSTP